MMSASGGNCGGGVDPLPALSFDVSSNWVSATQQLQFLQCDQQAPVGGGAADRTVAPGLQPLRAREHLACLRPHPITRKSLFHRHTCHCMSTICAADGLNSIALTGVVAAKRLPQIGLAPPLLVARNRTAAPRVTPTHTRK